MSATIIDSAAFKSQSLVLLPTGERVTNAEAERRYEESRRSRQQSPQSVPPSPADRPTVDAPDQVAAPVQPEEPSRDIDQGARYRGRRNAGMISAEQTIRRITGAVLGSPVESPEATTTANIPQVTDSSSEPGNAKEAQIELPFDETNILATQELPPRQSGWPKGPGTIIHDRWLGRGLSMAERNVLSVLTRCSSGRGTCSPSRAWLAGKLDACVASVSRWTRTLERKGWLTVIRMRRNNAIYWIHEQPLGSPTYRPVEKVEENSTAPVFRCRKSARNETLLSLLSSSLKDSIDKNENVPVQNLPERGPERKPASRELRAYPLPDEERELIAKHLAIFQQWIDKPLAEDRTAIKRTFEAGAQFGARAFQIGAHLYAVWKRVQHEPRLRPVHWGWFPAVVGNHFRALGAEALGRMA